MLMSKVLNDCKVRLSTCDFDQMFSKIEEGVYVPERMIDLSLSVLFIITEGDKESLHKYVEVLGKIVAIIRQSMSDDPDCKLPITTLNLCHMLATIQKVWLIVEDCPNDNHNNMFM